MSEVEATNAPGETEIRELLEGIVDPCSVKAGAPAGIVTMGLIRELTITPAEDGRTDVRVVIGLTEPGCLMGWTFLREAQDRLEALAGIGTVKCELDTKSLWTEEDLDPEYRAKLQDARRVARASHSGKASSCR